MFLREDSFFAKELPMSRSVKTPRFPIGVRNVFRANEINRLHGRRGETRLSVVLTICVAVFGASLLLAPKARAQSEDQIMAAFLFNFARYVEWPKNAFDQSNSPVDICVLGAEDFSGVVSRTVSGKRVGKRLVAVRDIESLNVSDGCHILFLGDGLDVTHAEVVESLHGRSIYSVSDSEGFAAAGGIANFIRAKSRIRFEINRMAAESVGLKISSRLLRLAKVVK